MNSTPDPMAMWHWVNAMNNGCGKIEDFPNRRLGLQVGGTAFYCSDISEQEKDLIDQNIVKLKLYGVELGLDTTPGCWDLSKVTVILRSVLAQDAKIRQANGGQYGFRDFFPAITVRISAVVTARGAAITSGANWASHRSIVIWNNGYSYWPIDAGNAGCIQSHPSPNCVNIFSPELITHEFGHALSNELLLSNIRIARDFAAVPGIENYVTVGGVDVSAWRPFLHGSQDTDNPGDIGRFYGNRLITEPLSAVGEIAAEGYAVWVHDYYNEAARSTSGINIDGQKQFWNAHFNNAANIR